MTSRFNLKMMLASSALAVSAMAAQDAAPSAKGFYLGVSGGIGASSHDYKQNSTVKDNTKNGDLPNDKINFGSSNGIFGVVFGYNFQKGNFVFGLDVNLGYDATNQILYDNSLSTKTKEIVYDVVLKYKKGFVGSIAPRLGFLMTPNSLVYVRLGGEYAKNTTTLTPNATYFSGAKIIDPQYGSANVVTTNKNSFSFAPGLGVEIYKNKVFLRLEYAYSFGSKITFTHDTRGINNDILNADYVNHTIKVPQHQIKFALGYKF